MAFLDSYRKKQHKKRLMKAIAQYEFDRQAFSLPQAKTVGLLFQATVEEDHTPYFKYKKKLEAQGKRVKLLGFFDDKEKREEITFPSFNRKDMNFWLEPNSSAVKEFINDPLDMVINFDFNRLRPLEYIAAKSKAKMRIGISHPDTAHCYDLMIAIKDKSTRRFIQEMEHYLKIFEQQSV